MVLSRGQPFPFRFRQRIKIGAGLSAKGDEQALLILFRRSGGMASATDRRNQRVADVGMTSKYPLATRRCEVPARCDLEQLMNRLSSHLVT